jgi:hypothetical protein
MDDKDRQLKVLGGMFLLGYSFVTDGHELHLQLGAWGRG